ncbi:helix-turn-helix domain-containing protein [Cohnella suwonensis]|uniref:Helix-turn-helix domain-containing protein n=1 Tax=Cohnella suwonensis TaxID=696072 RepID=A0ABW0LZC4_9BACL
MITNTVTTAKGADCRIQRTMVVQWMEDQPQSETDKKLVDFSIVNILEELLGRTGTVFRIRGCAFGLVLYGSEKELSDDTMETFVAFIDSCLANFAKVKVQIGIGSLMHTFLDLNKSIAEALQALERRMPPGEQDTHPFVEEVKSLLQRNYGDGVCLKSIAKQLYVNPAYLGRLFKSFESITFNHYLVEVRMEKAKELLFTTDKRIYEIAREVGYRQLDWFYKKFKEYTGYSPKEYKFSHSS